MMNYQQERRVGIEAVLKACELCSAVQHSLTHDEHIAKADRSPVTVADFGSQAIIVSHLLQHFPDDALVGEEEADVLRQDDQAALRDSVVERVRAVEPDLGTAQILDAIDHGAKTCDFTKRYWTLDPIDGTKGFLRGDQYAIALALVEDGEIVLGVLGCPNLAVNENRPDQGVGCVFTAVKGQGAFMRALTNERETPIHADQIVDPAQAIFCESVEPGHSSQEDHARIADLLGVGNPPYRTDGQCKYAIVARGDASIYLRLTTRRKYRSWIWDHAAGVIIVQEAGGTVTDMHGKPLDFSLGRKLFENSGVIATNGALHEAVLAAVRQVAPADSA